MRMPLLTLSALLAATALIAVGCGGSDNKTSSSSSNSSGTQGNTTDTTSTGASGGGGSAGSTLNLAADPGGALKFDKTTLTAKAGKVTVVMDNQSSTPHAVEVEGNGVEKKTQVVTGGTAKVTANLKPGKYNFYCPVDGHRAAGMKGTLTVN
jgi:uncharacterized cupredoxin-like copper-binding protein